jgi:hypothetical protein
MTDYLGLASADDDTYQDTVTGTGPIFGGLGPFSLSYPFSNYSDTLSETPEGELAFTGNADGAAVSKHTGDSFATFWGFPWEAIPTAEDRQATMQVFLDHCDAPVTVLFADDFEGGSFDQWSQVVP